jgi:Family of unknown function (DUF6510)
MSDPVDGNALGGDLRACMGREMTSAPGRCRHCGTVSMMGELVVYLTGPSPVARCRHCGNVVMLVHRFRDPPQIVWADLELVEPPAA